MLTMPICKEKNKGCSIHSENPMAIDEELEVCQRMGWCLKL